MTNATPTYFYGFYWTNGINKRTADNEPIGALTIFDTKDERDMWIADDCYENSKAHRKVMESHEAKQIIVRTLINAPEGDSFKASYHTISGICKHVPTQFLVTAYRQLVARVFENVNEQTDELMKCDNISNLWND